MSTSAAPSSPSKRAPPASAPSTTRSLRGGSRPGLHPSLPSKLREVDMKRYLIFAALFPLLGGFILLFVTTYQSGYWTHTGWSEVAKLFVVFAKTLQFSYLFGLLPTLMIAAVDDILWHVRRIRPAL